MQMNPMIVVLAVLMIIHAIVEVLTQSGVIQ
ncbi:hypothetical protein PBI_121Q_298 [Escherichia phage 121Q]|uniref:Uncharacterized protein n=1 Tax=Escherichia phage 121Q TaxID=1555202 RepID=A0A097EXQ2_9CAUD|nr:hypothetical protein PBI_121Q_298 [Escherichia phage 121Q]AIT14188.1 hypothetical protein PBI_121Q_298 [Escherichia phage 121Q]